MQKPGSTRESVCLGFISSSWGQRFAPQASCPHPRTWGGGWSQRLTGGSNSLFPINDCGLQEAQRGTLASEHYGALPRLNGAAVGGAISTNIISISVGAPDPP